MGEWSEDFEGFSFDPYDTENDTWFDQNGKSTKISMLGDLHLQNIQQWLKGRMLQDAQYRIEEEIEKRKLGKPLEVDLSV